MNDLTPLLFDYSAKSPEENIEIDKQLLHLSNSNDDVVQKSFLRFWESKEYFVCLGASNKAETEVRLKNTHKDNIPILKRCSGGGTVLQGPGCINYCIILPIEFDKRLQTIDTSNQYIMEQTKTALQSRLQNDKVEIKGYTDLTVNNIKFSGNAQRRLKRSILFHGSILYNFDIQKISNYLSFPSRVPDYRQNRSHLEFCKNISISVDAIKESLIEQWQAIDNKLSIQHFLNL